MKLWLGLPLAVVTLSPLAAGQERFTFDRKWNVGDKDAFRVFMQMGTQAGDVSISLKLDQKVVKTYDNGDADLEASVSEFKILFNGQDVGSNVSASANRTSVRRVNRYGVPVGKQEVGAGRGGLGFDYARYAALILDKSLRIGEIATIEYADPEDAKRSVKGTVLLESIAGGVAKLIAKYAVRTEETEEPVNCAITAYVRVSDSKLIKSEGTFSNVQGPQGVRVDAIQFRMERIEGPNGS